MEEMVKKGSYFVLTTNDLMMCVEEDLFVNEVAILAVCKSKKNITRKDILSLVPKDMRETMLDVNIFMSHFLDEEKNDLFEVFECQEIQLIPGEDEDLDVIIMETCRTYFDDCEDCDCSDEDPEDDEDDC